MSNEALLGHGPGAPFSYQGRGRFADAAGEDAVLSAMYLLLSTAPGEDPMRPEFGCRVWELVFMADTPALAPLAARYVRDALARWEPRVIVDNVTATSDGDGGYVVSLTYRLITSNSPRNQVFTFNGKGGE
jgi:phage baseplate assembly protein W